MHIRTIFGLSTTKIRKTKEFFGRLEAPCRTAIQKLVENFELLGKVIEVMNKTRARRSGCSPMW